MTALVIMSVLVGVLLVGSGVLVITIAERAADGRLGANGWAGIRTRATRSSDEAWRLAHQAARKPTALGGWLMAAAGVLSVPVAALFADGDQERFGIAWSLALLAGATPAVGAIVYGAVIANRVAARHRAEHGPA